MCVCQSKAPSSPHLASPLASMRPFSTSVPLFWQLVVWMLCGYLILNVITLGVWKRYCLLENREAWGEGERERKSWSVKQNTRNIYWLSLPSGCGLWHSQNKSSNQGPLITDHLNKYNKFEMWDLSNCDTETRNQNMLLNKWNQQICSMQNCHNLQKITKHRICKAQWNEAQ